jgi:hypothetical protein
MARKMLSWRLSWVVHEAAAADGGVTRRVLYELKGGAES